MTRAPSIGGAERRARKRASSMSKKILGARIASTSAAVWTPIAEPVLRISWEGGRCVLVGRVKRATKETRD
jgi:hypothetical protein